MTKLCALCQTPLSDANRSKEHILPNAIGGRKTTNTFICRNCNSRTGEKWDSALVSQLQSFCTLLDISRAKGTNQPLDVETVSGRQLTWYPDGSLTPRKPKCEKRSVGGKIHVEIQARTIDDAKRMLTDFARGRSDVNVEQLLFQTSPRQEHLEEPIQMSHTFGGISSGRSTIKSCLALVYEAGLTIDNCENAKDCLVSDGELCFGYYNATDPIKNRPQDVPLHCVYISANPESGQVLGYIEYFGFQKMVACLSSNYRGSARELSYAINPLTGEELDIEVVLHLTPDDIRETYDYKRWDYERAKADLANALAIWRDIARDKAITHAVDDAIEYACSQMGVQDGDELSDDTISEFCNYAFEKLAPVALRLRFGQEFSTEELQAIESILTSSRAGGIGNSN